MDLNDAPMISYNGKWLSWHLELYDNVMYWETWLFSSGVLAAQSGLSYKGDVWGISGGSSTNSSSNVNSAGGRVGQIKDVVITETPIAVTIGAGVPISNSSQSVTSGDTKFGAEVVASGITCNHTPISATNRFRFSDPNKAGEAGGDGRNGDLVAGGGWMPVSAVNISAKDGVTLAQGFGAAGTFAIGGTSGALVLRILA